MKRSLDLTIAGLALIVLSPLLVVLHVLVRLDSPGAAIFRQRRVGLRGQEFEILKFRSMRIGSAGTAVTVAQDARITRLGGWMRSKKLDELPQLINVLRGEMSLVGPRPELPEYVDRWPESQRRRILSVRPGITDPASVEFRRESELLAETVDPEGYYLRVVTPRKCELYMSYVARRSTLGDLQILLRTAIAVLTR